MENNDKKIILDLDFLEKEGPQKLGAPPRALEAVKPKKKSDTVFWVILSCFIGFIVLVVIAASLEEDSLSSTNLSPPSASQSDSVIVGDYTCSQYNSDQVDSLKPNIYTENQINADKMALQSLSDEIDELADEIDSTYTDTNSQYSIDNYNSLVEEHNQLLIEYNNLSNASDARIDKFNAQVEAHNRYLASHCTKN